ncbi:tripartite tricarboxylate transporter TctB family protein [Halogeometricum sp. S1BR25-6]|uniref:Tripartite tricarboxylate transporter TctB family protein n=1 Tax=Halogeometricum salsisoli TaxID=2950536 RepID=A0ABU2GCF7_9EURY|nr:tripartite tricarboxylate transporter TctB family protein [Halogeometricum sp. S1BR25-6]MDS0297928.1 tripartite tricarboxylate transporter TctB family protein [Halogeometricum sp. S1BR25-6]
MTVGTDRLRSSPLAVAFIVGAAVVILFAAQFPSGGEVGPGFFPIGISAGIILFALVELVTESDGGLDVSDHDLRAAGVVFALVLGYLLMMPLAGFLVGTILFLPVILYYSGVRSPATILLMSILLPVALFYIFSQFFLVPLPEGVIPFSRLLPRLPVWVML